MIKVFRIILVLVCLALIGWAAQKSFHFLSNNRVDAAGALTFNIGVSNGQPIFTFSNIAPGFTTSHTVTANNGDTVARKAGVKGIKTSSLKNLENVMHIVISSNGTDLYGGSSSTGPKTLKQFFADSQSINGVELTTINPGNSTQYVFTVTFDTSANNQYQQASVLFDLSFGIVTSLPAACEGMKFNKTIYGTSGNDNIQGTVGNDLIIGFEGNDRIDGGVGNDCIVGGTAGGNIQGGVGNDVIIGSEGVDKIDGGVGADKIYAFGGNDTINGGVDNDEIYAGAGNDSIDAEVGNDKVYGEQGNDTMLGGVGDDLLDGGVDIDSANGQVGKDTCGAETKISCEVSI